MLRCRIALWSSGITGLATVLAATVLGAQPAAARCQNTVTANVVALEAFIWYNRLGAHDPDALLYALAEDVVASDSTRPLGPGNARLRPGKRPRPLTLRVNEGDCLQINFTNLLGPRPGGLGTSAASVHVVGMQLVTAITDDGSRVQANPSSLVEPGQRRTYRLHAEREGTYLMYSTAQTTGGEGDGGTISRGLFGAVNVEPRGAEWYRSQVTAEDLRLATRKDGRGNPVFERGYPVIDYDARYPAGHPRAGRPILRIAQENRIVHGDLTAIITGPRRGNFPPEAYPNPDVPVYNEPDPRLRPFREFTIVFHDETGLVQAFDSIFESRELEHTLHGGRDAFAINYGTGGIGAEILANRFGLGPMWQCNDCKFEEFFLSSWAVGDPAMVVDVPASAGFSPTSPRGPRATRVFFPDDPSNVYHGYLNDHTKIRNLHAGPKEHHIFHLHAHQWLHTPNATGSNYDDSQAIGPGGGYTYEIAFGGAGNRVNTVGDAIFHCHFYPHFAQGMWALWRVHDVFEGGTALGADGRPAVGARALPDGEIAGGTPIPALVPLPTYALAPLPTDSMPGYPFYIPGQPGHRPPRPPLDVARSADGTLRDGGLARHVVVGGTATFQQPNRLDFSKHDETLNVRFLPEGGTPAEEVAMRFHARRFHRTPVADAWARTDTFQTNGRPAAAGAPFADPCPASAFEPDTFLAAAFQVGNPNFRPNFGDPRRPPARYNKAEWLFAQHRMFGLWDDVRDFRSGRRAPEPMFIRVFDKACVEYHLVNLIPEEYVVDDFQVQSPTDIIGQHIHLVKFDVTSSDGSANGFNYEDGSLAPGDVRHRIDAIRRFNRCPAAETSQRCPRARRHPFFREDEFLGAQETIQRWWVDGVSRERGGSSRQGTVFTHDHFGPSTHQQAGLYAGVLPEDSNTVWRDPETNVRFGTRADGGPTSWRADILYPANPDSSFREFALATADFTLAYGREGLAGSAPGGRLPPINPPGKFEVGLPFLIRPPLARNLCPNEIHRPPCPEIVSAEDPGTMVVNYRNEPLALRVRNHPGNTQAAGDAGDLSHAFSSRIRRADRRLNTNGPYGARVGVSQRDPFTPLMRVYEDDGILVRLLVGSHEEGHNFSVHGSKWLFAPHDPNSGYRNSQFSGISEFFEFNLDPLVGDRISLVNDYLYQAGSATDDLWNGIWGIIRSYREPVPDLLRLDRDTSADETRVRALEAAQPRRPVSLSLEAARVAETREIEQQDLAPETTVLEPLAPPDPNDTTAWEGENEEGPASLELMARAATAAVAPDKGMVAPDSEELPYEYFEFHPWASPRPMEYLITSDVAAAQKQGFRVSASALALRERANDARGTLMERRGRGFRGVCPTVARVRYYDISAVSARTALRERTLTYNSRGLNGGPLHDSTAILYVHTADLTRGGRLLAGVPREPLVLRANAGECIHVRLRNRLRDKPADLAGFNTLPIVVDRFNANQVAPSEEVGLHPQLVSLNVQNSDGSMVGINRSSTVLPGRWRSYVWYAGENQSHSTARVQSSTPVEFGATNLVSSDRIKHPNKGAIAALIIEPAGSTFQTDPASRAAATIRRRDGTTFRELVLLYQDDINLRFGSRTTLPRYDCRFNADDPADAEEERACSGTGAGRATFQEGAAVPNLAEAEDPEDSGQKAFNYRTEPLWLRMGFAPNAELDFTKRLDFRGSLAGDSAQTPILTARAGQEVRIRVLQPGGHARNHVFNVHGHIWEELPYDNSSRVLGVNPLSEWKGTRDTHGPTGHWDLLLKNGAGGISRVPGDYLYRDQPSFLFDGGLWGIIRVLDSIGSAPAAQ